ncbi:MAG: DMT family transporter [Clostridium sp.]|uniref:DMT family transporter n=1 Tax=Clostridium sp. TaxID=1506 RepID=UPI0025BEF107|nr:DMT family transporter [Clostridium sp.]MCH3963478.1 DMT family transporter [Clostridium sp.]MCI1714619.1 DMT family transporter [Clostridium sp.]MCI1799192.1 DMT family transporter [Clostridium sp.]MCI1812802.1 DMT family transporter [Clostridium sp.]MCI1869692.1 DMT family transporter [Clostridium sp.]
MNINQYNSILCAILSALLYAISLPISKILLKGINPTLMSALLYLGAGVGMLLFNLINCRNGSKRAEKRLTKNGLPFIIGMIVLDIAAPILLMVGLTFTTSSDASLLSNFEIAATSLIAFIIFKEHIGRRLFLAIVLITISCIILSLQDSASFSLSIGSLFIISGCICWGFENNCTKMLSVKDPIEIVVIKGIGASAGSFLIVAVFSLYATSFLYILAAVILGFFSYGLSIFFYIYAQRYLGAARTSAYYALSPFIGAGLSFIILKEKPTVYFIFAFIVMAAGTYLLSTDTN